MLEGYWAPKNTNIGAVPTTAFSPAGSSNYQEPKAEIPEVGTKLLLAFSPYGGCHVVKSENLVGGLDLVEVEVTGLKKSKTTLE